MAPRFDRVKFNLMRAIELFEDMNHEDMDVTAPNSSNHFKELQVAERLNECLGQLIDEGLFDDCAPRDDESESLEDEEGEEHSLPSTPRSRGFDYTDSAGMSEEELEGARFDDSQRRGSRESFTDRFKRYIKRMLPSMGAAGSRRARLNRATEQQETSLSQSQGRNNDDDDDQQRSAADEAPYDPSPLGNEHQHRHDIHDHHHGELRGSSSSSPRSNEELEDDYEERSASLISPAETSVESGPRSGGARSGRSSTRSSGASVRSRRTSTTSRSSRRASRSSSRGSRRSATSNTRSMRSSSSAAGARRSR